MSKISSFTMIKKLTMVAVIGVILSACANPLEGVGTDLQSIGNSLGSSNTSNTSNTNNQSQTKGKDVVVTPIK